MTNTPRPSLAERIADAARAIRIRPGHNSLAIIKAGGTVTLSGNEADRVADAVMAVIQPELDRRDVEIDRLTTEIAEGIANQTMLKGLNVQDGRVCLEIEPAREMLLILVASMREMLDDAGAENYLTTEATFPPAVSLDLQDGQHPEDSYTLTVQRRHRPTAHDFRRRAEAERDEARAEIDRLRTAAQSAATLLRSTHDKAITGQPLDLDTLRHAANALNHTTATTS
ncbi:hypothetical protein ACIRVF_08005 [Kitasatospora sp. NPDC101157]|uniref:hypothetical protein n=1 Tax=Kitasatospora sp. NPDC101157 TaxID=3364098 RepID=UPI00381DFE65